jgi:hypothetical protein
MSFDSAAVFCGPNNKVFDNTAVWTDGLQFAAYGGLLCKAIGLDMPEMLRKAGDTFTVGESTAVERALMKTRFVANAAGDNTVPGSWPAPTDITPAGGAVKPAVGVALLEGYASSVYVGLPTLHVPVVIGSLLLGVPGNAFDGESPETALGSKIAVGAGYDFPNTSPTGAAAAAGEKWIYASGEVLVLRGETILRQEFNQENNEVTVLAERPYIVAVDTFVAAVRVQVAA